MNTETTEKPFSVEQWDNEVCHICREPFTYSLCGIFRGNHVLLDNSDLPDCPICAALTKEGE
jgi:hypothetical protein